MSRSTDKVYQPQLGGVFSFLKRTQQEALFDRAALRSSCYYFFVIGTFQPMDS